jgi:hypothetical protein
MGICGTERKMKKPFMITQQQIKRKLIENNPTQQNPIAQNVHNISKKRFSKYWTHLNLTTTAFMRIWNEPISAGSG